MPPRKNDPNNQFVKKPSSKPDSQPWNRSKIEVEPLPEANAVEPRGSYSDRIRIPAMDEKGVATPRAVKNWPEGIKKA